MKTSLLWLVLLTGVVSSCSSSKEEVKEMNEEIIPVKVMALERSRMKVEIKTSGVFTTDDETMLSFKQGGIVKSVEVNEGDFVKQGQVLATLEMTEITAAVEQAQLAHEKALRDFNRTKILFEDSVATREQLENAKTACDLSKRQLDAATFNGKYATIRAGVNGYVLKKFVNAGQLVAPGTPVLQINGAGKGEWMLNAGVSDAEWAFLSIGDPALITTDSDPDDPLEAEVSRKSEGVDPLSGTFMVQLKLKKAGKTAIASGLFGKATIAAGRANEGWQVPMEALLDSDGNKADVFVTDDKVTARKVKVQVAQLTSERVLISKGLENAAFLIVSGNAYLTDQSKIKIIE